MTDTTQPEALHAGIADSHMGIERLREALEAAAIDAAMKEGE